MASLQVVNVKTRTQQCDNHLYGLGGMPSGDYGTVTATRSVVTSVRSAGIGSPVRMTLPR